MVEVRFFDGHSFFDGPLLPENNDSFNGKITFKKDNKNLRWQVKPLEW